MTETNQQKNQREQQELNRIHNSTNPHQGAFKRVLCVCSAGLLRSPTTAMVLAGEPWNYNTRAAGLESSYALVPVDSVLLNWADEIVCMTLEQWDVLKLRLERLGLQKSVTNLDIEDSFAYRDPELIKLIKERMPKPIILL